MLYPSDCVLYNDSILVVTENRTDSVFSRFDTRTGNRISSFGSIGDGPSEYLHPRLWHEISPAESVAVIDKTGCFQLSFDNGTDTPESAILLDWSDLDLPPVNHVLKHDSLEIIFNTTSDKQLIRYNPASHEKKYLNLSEADINGKFDPFGLNMQIFDAAFASNNKVIAVAYKYWNMIDLFDTETDMVRHLRFDDYSSNFRSKSFDTSNDVVRDPELSLFFMRAIPSDNAVYALTWNGTSKSQVKDGGVSSSVIKISWDGEVICRYDFDIPISTICLNPDGEIAYAIGMSPEDYGIHLYKVSGK